MRIIGVVVNLRTLFLHASDSSFDLQLVVNPPLRALTRVEELQQNQIADVTLMVAKIIII